MIYLLSLAKIISMVVDLRKVFLYQVCFILCCLRHTVNLTQTLFLTFSMEMNYIFCHSSLRLPWKGPNAKQPCCHAVLGAFYITLINHASTSHLSKIHLLESNLLCMQRVLDSYLVFTK